MGLWQILNQWKREDEWLDLSEITVVLHTSCVSYTPDDLRCLETARMRWCIPDNVRVELNMLTDCPDALGENARRILRNAGRFGTPGRCVDGKRIWDLEQLYKGCARKVRPEDICCGAMLFLFGDLAKQNEFLENAVSLPGHYVLAGTNWNCVSGFGNRIQELSTEQERLRKEAAAFWTGKKVTPIGRTATRNPLRKLRRIWTVKGSGRIHLKNLPAGEFHETDKKGNYGELFTASRFSGKLLKVYKKDKALRGNDIAKMNFLTLYGESLAHLPLAMPEELLKWINEQDEEILIGYVMKTLSGRPIRYYCNNGWDELDDPYRALRSTAKILVELHCRHILVNDLSYNNILVDDEGNAGLVDCDSFQITEYPGGQMTEIYRHPGVCVKTCDTCLRQPRYEYFAFAVLMYQCVMHNDPLLIRHADPDVIPSWETREFPLDWNVTGSENVNSGILDAWRGQDEPTRKAFSDIFHFRADYSIGALMRELGLA